MTDSTPRTLSGRTILMSGGSRGIGLAIAVRAAQEGQGDSARSAVDRLLAATAPTDSLYPEILYTHAMVAGSAADMRRHLQCAGPLPLPHLASPLRARGRGHHRSSQERALDAQPAASR